MNKEYLIDYSKKEQEHREKFCRDFLNGVINLKTDIYPTRNRFINLQYPISLPGLNLNREKIFTQIPFGGSLLFQLPVMQKKYFETIYFKHDEITDIIKFIKETGRLQIVLPVDPTSYENLDYLQPFFEELHPPRLEGLPLIGEPKEYEASFIKFFTLAEINYSKYIKTKLGNTYTSANFNRILEKDAWIYAILDQNKNPIIEQLDEYLLTDSEKAEELILACKLFIVQPQNASLETQYNYDYQDLKYGKILTNSDSDNMVKFPTDIGKFLINKLTYAPIGLESCYELLDHYDSLNLQKIMSSLNRAITTNNPSELFDKTKEFEEILDDIWGDKTIPIRIKGLQVGIPIALAVVGQVVAGPIGTAGGLLAGLGYNILEKTVDAGTSSLSKYIAKVGLRSFQITIYNFKEKYMNNLVSEKKI